MEEYLHYMKTLRSQMNGRYLSRSPTLYQSSLWFEMFVYSFANHRMILILSHIYTMFG